MKEYKNRPVTVDAVITRGSGEELEVLLVLRAREPFKGKWAIPGGFVEWDESCEQAVVREAKEETGISVRVVRLVGVYSDPKRDPRGTVSAAFLCEPVSGSGPCAGDDAEQAKWFSISNLPELVFDHNIVLSDAIKLI